MHWISPDSKHWHLQHPIIWSYPTMTYHHHHSLPSQEMSPISFFFECSKESSLCFTFYITFSFMVQSWFQGTMQIRWSYPVSLMVQSSFAGPTLFMFEYNGATCIASLLHSLQSDTGSIPLIWIHSLHYFNLRNCFEQVAPRRVKLFYETLETLFLISASDCLFATLCSKGRREM